MPLVNGVCQTVDPEKGEDRKNTKTQQKITVYCPIIQNPAR